MKPQSPPSHVAPVPWAREVTAYSPPPPGAPITLKLDANEGASPAPWLVDALATVNAEAVRRYPRPREFEAILARRFGLDPERVLVTAGGDDAIDRACRAVLGPGRDLVLPVPTFEMFARYAAIAGAGLIAVPWPGGPFPTDEVIRRVGPRTAMIAVVSPNNPTGCVIDARGLARVSAAAEGSDALVLADFAYAEFADEDLTDPALSLHNVLVVRTLSKAWGLAGLRVGFALGPPRVVSWLRAAGGPYAVSGLSLAIARAALENADGPMGAAVALARDERQRLARLLGELGVLTTPSQGNFVFARFPDADAVRAALAARGIGVRGFPGDPLLSDALRITVPCDAASFDRLSRALRDALTHAIPTRGVTP